MLLIDVKIQFSISPDPVFWKGYEQLISMMTHQYERDSVTEASFLDAGRSVCGESRGVELIQGYPRYQVPRSLVSFLAAPLELTAKGTLPDNQVYVYKNALITRPFYVAMSKHKMFSPEPHDDKEDVSDKMCANEQLLARSIKAEKTSPFISNPFHYKSLVFDGHTYKAEGVEAMTGVPMSVEFVYRFDDARSLSKIIGSQIDDYIAVTRFKPELSYVY